jgi:predicted metal-dependent enzyme (double-stranded beta helix superfamily)
MGRDSLHHPVKPQERAMPDLERFIHECREAARADMARRAVGEIVERFIARSADVFAVVGEQPPGIYPLHLSPELTIVNVVWAPDMAFPPHDHTMWAAIGIYAGAEDNLFWHSDEEGRLSRRGLVRLEAGRVRLLGDRVIHSVTNPLSRLTGGIHVYGGDLPNAPGRREWNAATLEECPIEPGATIRRFEDACRGKDLVW